MRKAVFLFLLCVCAGVSALSAKSHNEIRRDPEYKKARVDGANTRIILKVRDDQATPVADVNVSVRMGMTFAEKSYDVLGKTDANGDFVMEGVTTGNEISISLVKPGFYDSHCQLRYADMRAPHEVKDGKWQPYPMERTVTLRKIRNPVALVHVGKIFVFPATNTWVGFDMKACDFVAPNGTGDISDFACMVEWDGLPPTKSKYCRMSLRMSGELSGGYYQSCVADSEYPYAYFAKMPECFLRDIDIVSRNGDPCATEVPFRKNSEFITRTRCKVDEQGNLISSNYGSIRVLGVSPSWDGNPTLKLRLVFNPVPNDTNLEDDEVSLRHAKVRSRPRGATVR